MESAAICPVRMWQGGKGTPAVGQPAGRQTPHAHIARARAHRDCTHLCLLCSFLNQQSEVCSCHLVVLYALTQTSLVILVQTSVQHYLQPACREST